jgi:hypothetical protein
MFAGYSTTPLAKKLGIKPGSRMKLINAPEHYFSLFADMPDDVIPDNRSKQGLNFIHFFTKDAGELGRVLPGLKNEIVPNGIVWVSWPKKSAKVSTDVHENLIRDIALEHGLVDIKVCAVDDTWSGLKLVIPVKDR